MYRCIQPLSKAFIEANFPQNIHGVPEDLNDDVHSALKKQVCTWCILAVQVVFGVEVYIIVSSQKSETDGWMSWTSEPAQFFFFFVQKQINSMIKITYKVQSFAFKAWLRVFLKQFNIDQSQRESLLQYFVTRFSDDMTRPWRGSMENTDRSQSSSTCMMVTKRMVMMIPKVAGWLEHWLTSLTCAHKSINMSLIKTVSSSLNSRATLGWVNQINQRHMVESGRRYWRVFEQHNSACLRLTMCFDLSGRVRENNFPCRIIKGLVQRNFPPKHCCFFLKWYLTLVLCGQVVRYQCLWCSQHLKTAAPISRNNVTATLDDPHTTLWTCF